MRETVLTCKGPRGDPRVTTAGVNDEDVRGAGEGDCGHVNPAGEGEKGGLEAGKGVGGGVGIEALEGGG